MTKIANTELASEKTEKIGKKDAHMIKTWYKVVAVVVGWIDWFANNIKNRKKAHAILNEIHSRLIDWLENYHFLTVDIAKAELQCE